MWDFIIYLKCCKYDGCRVASRCCSRLVLRCESDSDLDSQGKTVGRYILCKLSPRYQRTIWNCLKTRWLSENSECYFLNLSNIRQPGAENPPDYCPVLKSGEGDWQIESRQHGGEGVRQNFEKQRFTGKCSPFPFFFSLFPLFSFSFLTLFLFQFIKILRSLIIWMVAEICRK